MELKLKTERLLLRPFEINDAETMFNMWANDDEVTKYLTWNTHKSIEETKEIINIWLKQYEKPERINCAIVLESEKLLIGSIDVVGYLDGIPVIGYCIARNYWNKGYTTEACKCLLQYLFDNGYDKVRIDAVEENVGSNKVIQKCGGKLIGVSEEFIPSKNITHKINQYEVIVCDFNKML